MQILVADPRRGDASWARCYCREVSAVLKAVFVYMVNVEDEGPRCLGGSAPSLLQYYHEIYVDMTILEQW